MFEKKHIFIVNFHDLCLPIEKLVEFTQFFERVKNLLNVLLGVHPLIKDELPVARKCTFCAQNVH